MNFFKRICHLPKNHFNSLQELPPANCGQVLCLILYFLLSLPSLLFFPWFFFPPCFLLLCYFYLSAQFFATQIVPPASSSCLLLILLWCLSTINLVWSVTMAFSNMVHFFLSLYRAFESFSSPFMPKDSKSVTYSSLILNKWLILFWSEQMQSYESGPRYLLDK